MITLFFSNTFIHPIFSDEQDNTMQINNLENLKIYFACEDVGGLRETTLNVSSFSKEEQIKIKTLLNATGFNITSSLPTNKSDFLEQTKVADMLTYTVSIIKNDLTQTKSFYDPRITQYNSNNSGNLIELIKFLGEKFPPC